MGWVGSILFASCAIPQCWKTWKTKRADDISSMFLGMWFFGEIFTFFYVLLKNIEVNVFQYPLLGNYIFNFILLCFLIYAKLSYKEKI